MPARIFVGHVYNTEQIEDLRWALREGTKLSIGVELWFSDEHPRSGYLLEKIKEEIEDAFACFFDISIESKPNVFIELGYALGRGKPSFLLCRRGSPIPADLQGLERIEYSSYNELARLLQARLGEMFHGHFGGGKVNKQVLLLVRELAKGGSFEKQELIRLAASQGINASEVVESVNSLSQFRFLQESSDRIEVIDREALERLIPLASN